jgi:hypothetical protein
MKPLYLLLVLAMAYTLCSAMTCCKPVDGILGLEPAHRPWLPVQGRTSIIFYDEGGVPHTFGLREVDTLETFTDKCGNEYEMEYVKAALQLDASRRDSLVLMLSGPRYYSLTVRGASGIYLYAGDLLHYRRPGLLEPRTNLVLGGNTYPEWVLVLADRQHRSTIDSVYVAKSAGLVGFTYLGRKYTL